MKALLGQHPIFVKRLFFLKIVGWAGRIIEYYWPQSNQPCPPSGFAQRGSSLALLGETPRPLRVRPTWLFRCSTWGDPKTALDSPVALLGETPRPHAGYAHWTHQLLYLGRPQDRTGSPFCKSDMLPPASCL